MKKSTYQIIGLMSGSSLDGIDLAHCSFESHGKNLHWKLNAASTLPFSKEWTNKLLELTQSNSKTLLAAHAAFGRYLGEQVNHFLQEQQLNCDIVASHGHTIFHYPEEQFTFQLGDGAAIAATTGIPTIDRFRAMDMAFGGQGAPVAPIVDRYLFEGYDYYLNIGGIANISAPIRDHRMVAFDIGGANQILDALAQIDGHSYDDKGKIAASGTPIPMLYDQINALPYFSESYPKSLGNDWVLDQQTSVYLQHTGKTADKLSTACKQLAYQTAKAILQIQNQEKQQKSAYKMLVTGGGAWNTFLIQQIRDACQKVCNLAIHIPSDEIIGFKEAILMALMGYLRMTKQNNCLATATGATQDSVSGSLHHIN